jgi:metallo-beta-lactamase family protein
LCSLVLPDSAHLQEEDAREANRHDFTKHKPALPLYTAVDAARALDRLQPVGYDRPVPVVGDMQVDFINAGHLLGSAYARVRTGDTTILFGGDLGRYGRPVLPDPSPVAEADILLLESTYGDRLHEPDDHGDRLAAIVNDTAHRGGKVIIPSFAIGRVEEGLYGLKRLEEEKRIPVLPVYAELSKPSATAAGRPRRDGERRVCVFCTQRMTIVSSPQQSADLVASRQSSIVISASGMATGGRVLRHLAGTISNPKNTVLFVGYQAAGTRGRLLVDGAKEIKLLGRVYPGAARIERYESMSAHADASEIMRFLSGFSRPPRMTYLVHGDPVALETLAAKISAERHWPVHVAAYRETVNLPT